MLKSNMRKGGKNGSRYGYKDIMRNLVTFRPIFFLHLCNYEHGMAVLTKKKVDEEITFQIYIWK